MRSIMRNMTIVTAAAMMAALASPALAHSGNPVQSYDAFAAQHPAAAAALSANPSRHRGRFIEARAADEAHEAEEAVQHEHHGNNGKHLGWFKKHGNKHYGDVEQGIEGNQNGYEEGHGKGHGEGNAKPHGHPGKGDND